MRAPMWSPPPSPMIGSVWPDLNRSQYSVTDVADVPPAVPVPDIAPRIAQAPFVPWLLTAGAWLAPSTTQSMTSPTDTPAGRAGIQLVAPLAPAPAPTNAIAIPPPSGQTHYRIRRGLRFRYPRPGRWPCCRR